VHELIECSRHLLDPVLEMLTSLVPSSELHALRDDGGTGIPHAVPAVSKCLAGSLEELELGIVFEGVQEMDHPGKLTLLLNRLICFHRSCSAGATWSTSGIVNLLGSFFNKDADQLQNTFTVLQCADFGLVLEQTLNDLPSNCTSGCIRLDLKQWDVMWKGEDGEERKVRCNRSEKKAEDVLLGWWSMKIGAIWNLVDFLCSKAVYISSVTFWISGNNLLKNLINVLQLVWIDVQRKLRKRYQQCHDILNR
jgi:hypothetical protein